MNTVVKQITRYGLTYYAVYVSGVLVATYMSEYMARQRAEQITNTWGK